MKWHKSLTFNGGRNTLKFTAETKEAIYKIYEASHGKTLTYYYQNERIIHDVSLTDEDERVVLRDVEAFLMERLL